MENKSNNNPHYNVLQELVRFSVVVSISKDTENWTNTPCDQFPHRLHSDSRSTLPCKAWSTVQAPRAISPCPSKAVARPISLSPQPCPAWSCLAMVPTGAGPALSWLYPQRGARCLGLELPQCPSCPAPGRWWDGLWCQALPCCCRELPLLLDPHGTSSPDMSIIRPNLLLKPSEKDPHCSYTCTWSFPFPLTLSAPFASTSWLHYDPFNIAIPHRWQFHFSNTVLNAWHLTLGANCLVMKPLIIRWLKF